MARKRLRISVAGKVQGVGFRQATYEVAVRHQIVGWVRNDSDGQHVQLEIEGESEQLLYVMEWLQHGPRLAQVEQVLEEEIPVQRDHQFEIFW